MLETTEVKGQACGAEEILLKGTSVEGGFSIPPQEEQQHLAG